MRSATLLLCALLAGCGDDKTLQIHHLKEENARLRMEVAAYAAVAGKLEERAEMQTAQVQSLRGEVEGLRVLVSSDWPIFCDQYRFVEDAK